MAEQPNPNAAEPQRGPIVDLADWRSGDGHPLKLWRQANGVKLDWLSVITGISSSSLSRIERYKQTPLVNAAKKIIAATNHELTPADFF
jgi:hypothetical protein